MTEPVLLSFDATTGIARITFNRPEVLNAADLGLAQGFLAAVRALALQEGLRCVVMTGAGRAFMAGGDIAGFGGDPRRGRDGLNAILDAMNPAMLTLRALEAPILSGVRGAAAGAGLSLAISADVVLAEEGARFVMGYDRIGGVPDCGGSWFLARKAGIGRAAELMMLSRALTAAEAMDWGLVTRTTPAEGFDETLEALARQLAAGPTRALAAFRRLGDAACGAPLAAHLEAERAAFVAMTDTADFAEGTRAFLEKRAPRFTGR